MKIIVVLILAAGIAVGAPEETYAIRMAPPVQTGTNYSVSATGHKVAKTFVGDRIVEAAEYEVSFQGRALVVDVDSRSRPVKIVFTVDKFTKVEAGAASELLKAGTVIVADGKQNPPIFLEDGVLEKPVLDAFHLVYATHKPNEVTDDDIFGARELKSVGQRWPMNRSLAVQSLKDSGIVVPADGLNGSVSLEAIDKIGKVDCLSLRGELTANGITAGGLPEGVTIDTGSLTAGFQGCFPIESRGLYRKEGTDMTFDIRASGSGTKFNVSYSEKHDAVWTPVDQ
jgi:hypothetical protein